MLLSTKVKVKWNSANKKWYIKLGYKFTKLGDLFEVNVNHLSKGSHVEIQWRCDQCNEIITGTYQIYKRYVKDDGKIYCRSCANKSKCNVEKRTKTRLKNGLSFEQWCLNNNRIDVLMRWDIEKNDCLPSDISYSSITLRWFKCDKHPEHHSELKSLNRFTSGQEGSITCNQCNSVAQSIIDLYGEENLYKIWNKELNDDLSPWDIPSCSRQKVWWNCLDDDKNHKPYLRNCNNSKRYGYRCPNCFEHLKGENNPNWNSNLTDEDRAERRSVYPGYAQFVKNVMARDNYTCQITGIKSNGKNLVVHHINGYNWDKEHRVDVNNGIVLCVEIHKLFHKLYGQGNNTEEQFNDFLEKIENNEININNIN